MAVKLDVGAGQPLPATHLGSRPQPKEESYSEQGRGTHQACWGNRQVTALSKPSVNDITVRGMQRTRDSCAWRL